MNSLEIRELESGMVEMLNKSVIPMEAKRLVVLEILGKLEKASDEEIRGQLLERRSNSKAQDECSGNEYSKKAEFEAATQEAQATERNQKEKEENENE